MKRILIFLIFCTLPGLGQSLYSETFQKTYFRGNYPQKIPVLFRAYPAYEGQNTYRIYLPVEIRYDYFQFMVDREQYTAGIEIEVHFNNQQSGQRFTRIWRTELTVPDYHQTRSRKLFHFTSDTLTLPPGRYDILFKYVDLNGEQRLTFNQRLTLPEVEQFYASPPLFFYPHTASRRSFLNLDGTPASLQMHWDFNRDLGVYLRFWRADAALPARAHIELLNAEDGHTVLSLDTTLAEGAADGTLQLRIPARRLAENKHRLKTIYKFAGDSTRKVIPFEIVWFNKPISLWDGDLSLKPLQYIVDDSTYQGLAEGNAEERAQKLRAFWEERDPTPETPFNELKNEFYSRVDSTLIRFSSKRKLGWETDLGKVYISQGPPDIVEDHSLDPVPNPFMRWIYLLEDRRLVYTFKALDGRKEYELAGTRESRL